MLSFGSSIIPALLTMMSSCPCLAMVVLMAFSTSDSRVTSHTQFLANQFSQVIFDINNNHFRSMLYERPHNTFSNAMSSTDAPPPVIEATLAIVIMLPLHFGIIIRAACLVPKNTPVRLTPITRSKSILSLSKMLSFASSIIPALLTMMSSCPCLAIVVLIAFSTSDSRVTSQWTKDTKSTPKSWQTSSPNSSLTSKITTFAPCCTNDLTIHFPMP
ncbi:hypothetical protein Ccrd_000196, partial [Cynara cardunculus var. scolymus]